MIIVLKKDADEKQVEGILAWLKDRNITPHVSTGERETLIGCIGDVGKMDIGLVQALSVVESVQRIQEPFKAANRKFHPDDSVVDCSGVKLRSLQDPAASNRKSSLSESRKASKLPGRHSFAAAPSSRERRLTLSRGLASAGWKSSSKRRRRRGYRSAPSLWGLNICRFSTTST